MSDKLEDYVMEITAPLDPIFVNEATKVKNFDLAETPNIIIETIENNELSDWSPKMPEHADGSQHLNVGLDFFSATRVESQRLEIDSHKPNHTNSREDYHFVVVPTGIRMELPYGYHMMMGSRSGLGFKKHIQAFPGIIDSSYRGEIMIKLYSPNSFTIDVGEKVAQGIIFKSQNYNILQGKVNQDTQRGESGFGSTDTPEETSYEV